MEKMADKNRTYNIVELGSSRSFVTGGVPGCMSPDTKYWYPNNPNLWDWGAGIFTKVFAENLKGQKCNIYTVDPDINANIIVTVMCDEYKNVTICKTYSTNFLLDFNDKIDFLYMDHMETSEEAAIPHLVDVKLIIDKNMMSEYDKKGYLSIINMNGFVIKATETLIDARFGNDRVQIKSCFLKKLYATDSPKPIEPTKTFKRESDEDDEDFDPDFLYKP
jgi:hypothetical protein